jgi:uncharacterized protein YjbI with pentapeptide repeats
LPECGNGKTTDACACDGNVCQAGQSCTGKAGARTCNGQGQPEPTGCEATLQEAGCTRDKKGTLICSGLDLTGADFSGCVLPAIHFKSVNLAGSLFDGAELDDATVFESVDLSGASFTNVNMAGVHVVASSLSGTIFDGAIWTGCGPKSSCNQIAKSNAIGASFAGANLTGLSLASSDFSGATFASATLDGTIIGGSIFANAVFDLVSMTNASDLSSTFVGASFCGASLDGTVFRQSICPDGTRSDKKLRTCAGHLGTEACPS